MFRHILHTSLYAFVASAVVSLPVVGAEVPEKLKPWLQPQSWQRDTNAPVVSLGPTGRFDDTHIFAPAVIQQNDQYWLYYCGSRGTVAKRVFQLGLATSTDGKTFTQHERSPVFRFGQGQRSVLTPAFLRSPDGTVLREDGELRMWFSSADFQDKPGLHTLHETTSPDGLDWSPPSDAQLKHVYSPTIIRDGNDYRMWYIDVSETWIVRHAQSRDGKHWRVTPDPCLKIDQPWERTRLFYPTVRRIDGIYVMWYGSYWTGRPSTTAIGFAVSLDGLQWHKHPNNPVHRPDPTRPWESHYVTSQSILPQPDGSYRMWYASRKKPPFLNKYFAINTAVWKPGEASPATNHASIEAANKGEAAFREWRSTQRKQLRTMLGIPTQRVPLNAEKRGEIESNGVVIEK